MAKRIKLNYEDGNYSVRGERVGCSVVWVRADTSCVENPIEARYCHDCGKDLGEWQPTQYRCADAYLDEVLEQEVTALRHIR